MHTLMVIELLRKISTNTLNIIKDFLTKNLVLKQKKQINEVFKDEAGNGKSEKFNTVKPSRTQRAINAKNDRLVSENSETSDDLQKAKKENYTSDGIEALKPFETSLNEEKTQSS